MRMTRTAAWLVMAALATSAIGCSRDAEVLAFAKDFEDFSNEIVKKVKTAPNPTAGVDAAQAYLDQNRDRLRQKLQSVKTVRGFQLSEESKKKMEASMMNGASAVAGLQMEYVGRMAVDPTFRAKIERLVGDYRNLVAD